MLLSMATATTKLGVVTRYAKRLRIAYVVYRKSSLQRLDKETFVII